MAKWRVTGEEKWLLKGDGSEIGPDYATDCEMQLAARVEALEKALRELLAFPGMDCHTSQQPGCKYCKALEAARKLLEGK